MELLLAGLGRSLDRSTKTGRLVLDWTGNAESKGDALALRLAGGLHAIIRRGELPDLAHFYKIPKRSDEALFIPLVLEAIENKDEELSNWLAFAPQTNEVARSAILYAGLLMLAEKHDLPFHLYELGSSTLIHLYCRV